MKQLVYLLIAGLTTAAALAATATAHSTSSQRIVLWDAQVGTANTPAQAAATGLIAGSGTARFSDARGMTDRATITLHGGTITITAVEEHTSFKPNYNACTLSSVGRGTFSITTGTGTYSNATGSGTYTRYSTIIGRHAPTGTCLGKHSRPEAAYDTIVMNGTANHG